MLILSYPWIVTKQYHPDHFIPDETILELECDQEQQQLIANELGVQTHNHVMYKAMNKDTEEILYLYFSDSKLYIAKTIRPTYG